MKHDRRSGDERRNAKPRRRVRKVLHIYGAPLSAKDVGGPGDDAGDVRAGQHAALVRVISDYLFYWHREADWPRLIERVNERLADLERKRSDAAHRLRPELSKPSRPDEAADALTRWKQSPGPESSPAPWTTERGRIAERQATPGRRPRL